MPIYEYQCQKCGREFEEWQKFSDAPVEKCHKCGGQTHRLISQSSFHLKGTGWYVTDYGRKDTASGKKPAKSKTDTTTCAESKTTDSGSSTTSTDS
ncbi:MAG: zinc ribbon domain-containing protein [Desulfomonile tiedjei]|nr:zinc ribbon domain-containing protein [Desulfomonile tiedjei]